MNVEELFKKLFKDHYHLYFKSTDKMVHMNVEIGKEELQDNIDLLAKELHMEVELHADKSKHVIKHERIEIEEDLVEHLMTESERGKENGRS